MDIVKVSRHNLVVQPTKVWVKDTENHTATEIAEFAMAAVGESRDRLFGWSVSESTTDDSDHTHEVIMHKD